MSRINASPLRVAVSTAKGTLLSRNPKLCGTDSRTLILQEKGRTIPHERESTADVAKFVRGVSQGAA